MTRCTLVTVLFFLSACASDQRAAVTDTLRNLNQTLTAIAVLKVGG